MRRARDLISRRHISALSATAGAGIKFLLLFVLRLLQEDLEYAPEWVSKARYRRGQAQNGKQNFDLALKDLLVVQKLQPNDAGVKKEIVVLKKVGLRTNL